MSRKKLRPGSANKPVKEQLKDMFSLHMSERRGSLVFMAILTLLSAWVIYEQWLYTQPTVDLEPIKKELEAWVAERQAVEAGDSIPAMEPFPFDPNEIDRSDWNLLGLSDRQIDGIMRFQEKGGKFRVKNDVARMYTISPELYARLEPYILLPDTLVKPTPEPRAPRSFEDRPRFAERPTTRMDTLGQHQPRTWPERERTPIAPMEVNRADTTELVTLPGIGPAFARGIVKYRESLGGYISMDQLAEVYVLRDKPEAVERLKEILYLDPANVRRIPINSATPEDLAAHPYISWKVANGLVNYRNHHGAFPDVESIRGSMLVNDSLYMRIAPYLTVE
jgi:competence protein ComEA